MRLKNSHARVYMPFDSDSFPGINGRGAKEAKLIVRLSDVVFDHAPDDNPIGLRVRQEHNLGLCQVIEANQLVFESNMHVIPSNCTIMSQCKIRDNTVTCSKEKGNIKKLKIKSFRTS